MLFIETFMFTQGITVSPMTAKSWENGRQQPSGLARRLLETAESHPRLFAPKQRCEKRYKQKSLGALTHV
jgi:hypothetical protein